MMKRSQVAVLSFAVAAVTMPWTVSAQALPTAQAVIDKHVEAVGGKAAITGLKSMSQKGTMEITAMGMVADINLSAAAPNKQVLNINIPGLGELNQGYNGTVGWDDNPMSGARVLEGEELTARKEGSFHEALGLYDASKFTTMEVVEKTQFAEEEAYKVRFVRTSGRESFEYYSVANGLRIGTYTKTPSPMGEVEVSAVISDYKKFGPVMVPTKVALNQAGQDIVQNITEVKFNEVDDSVFKTPASIEALVKP